MVQFQRFSSGKSRYISKRVPVFVTTDVFGAVVSLILAYLVVLLQVYGRRSCKFCFFSALGLSPPSRFWWSWVVARLAPGLCPPGLNFGLRSSFLVGPFLVARPFPFPACQGLTPLVGSPFFLSHLVAFFLLSHGATGYSSHCGARCFWVGCI